MKKFPLAPLVKLRARAVESCRETVQAADVHLETARQALARSEQMARAYDAERRAVEDQEASRLAAGELRALDLNRMVDYEVGARAQALRLHEQNQVQGQKVQRAEREHAMALQALAEARAEVRVIERRHEQFLQTERTADETRAEEEGLEIWQVRGGRC